MLVRVTASSETPSAHSLSRSLKNILKRSLYVQYIYRKLIVPALKLYSDTDELLLPSLDIRTGIDVGANAGTYALHLARVSKTLVCFEPVPFMQRLLNMLFAGQKHVIIRNEALSDRNGVATLSIPVQENEAVTAMASLHTAFPQGRDIAVNTIRLDDFCRESTWLDPALIDFIKIDVEGFENEVIAGMREVLAKAHPVLLIEIELRHNSRCLDLFAELREAGYASYVSPVGGALTPVSITTAEQLGAIQDLNSLALEKPGYRINSRRHYLNNFWFVHPDSVLKDSLNRFIRASD